MSETNAVPAINVNLRQCIETCQRTAPSNYPRGGGGHYEWCPAVPVLIPCPIRRSVTFEVRLGECDGPCGYTHMRGTGGALYHHDTCSARPIRVSCSIARGHRMVEWEESTVDDCEPAGGIRAWEDNTEEARALEACRVLWGYIKSAMLGHSLADCPEAVQALRPQRDAVFSALADMARAEEKGRKIQESMPLPPRSARHGWGHCIARGETPAALILGAYVEHLIEQVGAL